MPSVMATIGPTLEKTEDLKRAIEAGARWFRLPCGYRQRPHLENGRAVRSAASDIGIDVQLLLDLPSSRPRTGIITELRLAAGQGALFWDPDLVTLEPARNGVVHIPLPGLGELMVALQPNHRMWFCDGRLSFIVDELREGAVLTHMERGTVPLKSSNSIFLPDSPNPFCAFTSQDRELLAQLRAADLLPDWIALSLITSPEDVRDGRREATKCLGQKVNIMAKFETTAAVDCAEDIINVADGVMVARGDLGLAVGCVRLPETQERLVAAARRAGKPVVVATQVLEMFAETGVPQRAELSDLALMARQGADAVMLGKETVFSPRPIESIRLANEVLTYETLRRSRASRPLKDVPAAAPLPACTA
jgi:pyruvate kinase